MLPVTYSFFPTEGRGGRSVSSVYLLIINILAVSVGSRKSLSTKSKSYGE